MAYYVNFNDDDYITGIRFSNSENEEATKIEYDEEAWQPILDSLIDDNDLLQWKLIDGVPTREPQSPTPQRQELNRDAWVEKKIRSRYSTHDELKIHRENQAAEETTEAFSTYDEYVRGVIAQSYEEFPESQEDSQ